MRPHPHWLWLIVALALTLVGCQRGAAPVAPAAAPNASEASAILGEMSALGMWRLSIDATSLEAEATYLPERTASEQGDAFLLPLNRFITASTFELLKVGRVGEELLVTYRVTHPFAPPSDPTAPSTATNRADLGFAGVVLFLADVDSAEGQTFFDDVIANTSMIANADAYWQPGGMIARTASMTANCFPGLNVVDESGTGNRVGISNGGSPTGNFGTNGWTRADLGEAPFTGWTGYGVLHQGQAADRTVAIKLDAETSTSISLDVALIAKYTDPRGGSTPSEKQANRLPSKPADFRTFAYRMPHGALDVSECRVLTPADQLTVTNGEPALIDCEILDWDADALESTTSKLASDSDLGSVLPGTAGPVQLQFDCPSWLSAPVTGQPLTTGSPISRYAITVAADGSAPDGVYPGLLRMTDPEAQLPMPQLFVLDQALQPLAAFHPSPVAYQAVSLQVRALGSWAHLFQFHHAVNPNQAGAFVLDIQVDQAGDSYVLGYFNGGVNFAPEDGGPLLESVASYDTFVAGLRPNGSLKWIVRWPAPFCIERLSLSPGGALLYCDLQTPLPSDFDPGPGADLRDETMIGDGFLALRTVDGSYAGAVTWPKIGNSTRAQNIVLPNGHLFIALQFGASVMDLDPGPGTQQAIVSTPTLALVELDAAGTYLRSTLLGGQPPAVEISVRELASNAQGDLALFGAFVGTLDFDPGPVSHELTSSGSGVGNPYLLTLDVQGKFKWAQFWDTVGGAADFGRALTLTPSGAAVFSGAVNRPIDADPSDGITLLDQVGSADQDFFIFLDSDGTFRWAGTIGGTTLVHDILAVTDTTLLVTLVWSGLMDLDPSSQELTLQAQGSLDSGLLALSTLDGHVVTHLHVNPIEASGARVDMRSIANSPADGTLRWAGYYSDGQMDVDPGAGQTLLPVVDGRNGVVIRLNADGSW